MNKKELIKDVLKGKTVEKVPYCFYHHFSEHQRVGNAMIEAHISYYRKTNPDFVKVMFDNHPESKIGSIKEIEDWKNFEPIPISAPYYQDQLSGLKKIVEQVGDEVLIVNTVFNPYLIADAYTNWKFVEHLNQEPDLANESLSNIAQSLCEYAEKIIEVGADGIFFAEYGGESDKLSKNDFEKYVKPHDLKILKSAKDKGSEFDILHIHGSNLRLDMFTDYNSDCVNWDHNSNNLSLLEGRKLFKNTILGGVDQNGPFLKGNELDVKNETRKIISEMGKKSFILGSGCAFMEEIPTESFQWVREVIAEL